MCISVLYSIGISQCVAYVKALKCSCDLFALPDHYRIGPLNPSCLFNLCSPPRVSSVTTERSSVSCSLHPALSLTVIPPVSRNAVVFNFSQLLWLAARPPAFPHLFSIRPLRSPHKQSRSLWPPAPHQDFISKHGNCSPCAVDLKHKVRAATEPSALTPAAQIPLKHPICWQLAT